MVNRKLFYPSLIFCIFIGAIPTIAQSPSNTWNPNLPGGRYKNPIINADYSDPDACRVGNDYYLTSSSFDCFPGLQILHSTDLVNWEIVGAALTDDYPILPEYKDTDIDWHKRIQHGKYVFAPSIRFHDGWFYIFWGDPDQGLFMTKTQNPRGTWEKPVCVKEGKGMIDCCPFWDDDGKAYLSYACAGSRLGLNSVILVSPLSADGTHTTGQSRIVYDGHEDNPIIEGTKLYKRNGYYYILSPAGGVKHGWQVELRSKDIYGPYEEHIGLAQGKTNVNGPHQGAWVDTQNGEDWFIHFQDKEAYGRVIHLQPAKWVDGWLVIGNDKDGDGCGEPVETWTKPDLPSSGLFQPQEDDDFNSTSLGLQWQFEGPVSPFWYYCDAKNSRLRLYGVQSPADYHNISDLQNVLLQKFPAEDFTATARIRLIPNAGNAGKSAEGGFVIMGQDYAGIKIVSTEDKCVLRYVTCTNAFNDEAEKTIKEEPLKATPYIYVRAKVWRHSTDNPIRAFAQFSYSLDGKRFVATGTPFEVKVGQWIGAKLGFYCLKHDKSNDAPFLDIDWIRFSK